MNFYSMYAPVAIEDYVRPGPELDPLVKGCWKSDFQFLDRQPLEVSISGDSGLEFPDLIIYRACVPLVSQKFRNILDAQGVDNLFYKRITIADDNLGLREQYWLALPPRIECLNRRKSVVETEENEFEPPENLLRSVKTIALNPNAIGNYKIFKLPRAYENQEIIVISQLMAEVEKQKLVNVHFNEL